MARNGRTRKTKNLTQVGSVRRKLSSVGVKFVDESEVGDCMNPILNIFKVCRSTFNVV